MSHGTDARANVLRHGVGIFLLSLASLLLELSLMRALSVALWYHFGFLVISTALLGFAASGTLLALWPWLREKASLDRTLAVIATAFGVIALVGFLLLQRIPFDPFSLMSDPHQVLFMLLYYVVAALPFFCAGLATALVFSRNSAGINRLYAFNLVGAGLGAIALVVAMPAAGASGAVAIAATAGFLSAVVFGIPAARGWAATAALLALGSLALTPVAERALPIHVTQNKPHPPRAPLYRAWNSLSRIDVYEQPAGPFPGSRAIRNVMIDGGTANSAMVDLRPNVQAAMPLFERFGGFESSVAYLFTHEPKVLVIGSGAGKEVLDARHFGASRITAVEVNPIINDLVTHRMADFWGGLFDAPVVELVTEDGRSFVRRSRETYDAIISAHTISNAAVASGALALAEDYVLTREAFTDYLEHLSPDGMLYITRPEAQLPRLLATGRESLERLGRTDVAAHFYLFRHKPGPRAKNNAPSFFGGFLMKKSAFTAAEVQQLNAYLGMSESGAASPSPAAAEASELLYSPTAPAAGTIYQRLLATNDPDSFYASSPTLLAPATDDRPFFNRRTRWSDIDFAAVKDLFTQDRRGRQAVEDRPVAEITLLVLLAQVVVATAIFLVLPALRTVRPETSLRRHTASLTYFAAIGLGFILIEIGLLQRLALFLGQPVYTFAVVLGGLLCFCGVGAYLSNGGSWQQQIRWIVPAVVAVLIATTLLMPWVFSIALGLPFAARVFIALVLIAPLGVLLGMPFPIGLRAISHEGQALLPMAWAVNGFFTVCGTVLAQLLSMTWGSTVVFATAALCYVIAIASARSQSETADASLPGIRSPVRNP